MRENWTNIPQEKLDEFEETMEDFGQPADPDWFDGKRIDEIAFCSYLLKNIL